MRPIAIQLLRRLSAYCLALSALLVIVPRLVSEFGVPGTRWSLAVQAQAKQDEAAQALDTARLYGASDDLEVVRNADADLLRAREHSARKEHLQALRAAKSACSYAIDAQRLALARREASRRGAESTVVEIDRILERLEQAYTDVQARLDKTTSARIALDLKDARRRGSALRFAYDAGNYQKVLEDGGEAKESLAMLTEALEAARKGSSHPRGPGS